MTRAIGGRRGHQMSVGGQLMRGHCRSCHSRLLLVVCVMVRTKRRLVV